MAKETTMLRLPEKLRDRLKCEALNMSVSAGRRVSMHEALSEIMKGYGIAREVCGYRPFSEENKQ